MKLQTPVHSILLLIFLLSLSAPCRSEDEFSFDIQEVRKKNFEWGGYGELKWVHMDANQDSAFKVFIPEGDRRASLDRLSGTLQLDGNYSYAKANFHWLMQAAGQQDNIGWTDTADIFEAYGSIKPSPHGIAALGKKSYKWGKGYAWNPVGFINRLKDPDDPDEAREGYITAEVDLIKSFNGSLQNIALTTVLLPVWDDINDDFGRVNNLNLAAKLYFLILDTDIDLLLLTGNSRADGFGLDFAKNLATNFEIHGELAWQPNRKKYRLHEAGTLTAIEEDTLSTLIGIRYLSENDITSIIEYYHNGGGYSEEEMSEFYRIVHAAGTMHEQTADQSLLEQAREMSLKGYGSPHPGRNYLYARFTQKEPFDILYLTPALTTLVNLDDNSYSLTPEILYTGFTNWEVRLRFYYLGGGSFTEYGEKINSNKLELRLRYFF